MSIDKQSDIAANLQIGPTNLGMVRIYIEGDGIDLPLDFDPDEAEEIAEELLAAARIARGDDKPGGPGGKPGAEARGRTTRNSRGADGDDRARGKAPGRGAGRTRDRD